MHLSSSATESFSVSMLLSGMAAALLIYGIASFARPRYPGEPTDWPSLVRRWFGK